MTPVPHNKKLAILVVAVVLTIDRAVVALCVIIRSDLVVGLALGKLAVVARGLVDDHHQ